MPQAPLSLDSIVFHSNYNKLGTLHIPLSLTSVDCLHPALSFFSSLSSLISFLSSSKPADTAGHRAQWPSWRRHSYPKVKFGPAERQPYRACKTHVFISSLWYCRASRNSHNLLVNWRVTSTSDTGSARLAPWYRIGCQQRKSQQHLVVITVIHNETSYHSSDRVDPGLFVAPTSQLPFCANSDQLSES